MGPRLWPPENNWFNIFEKSEVEAKVEAEVWGC